MLNIGPRANGDVPYEITQRMLEMGKWLDLNGEAIYGAEAFDLRKDQHDWGKITCKETSDSFKLYLHVYTWPLNRVLNLTGILQAPEKVYVLADKQKLPLEFTHLGAFTEIKLPALRPDQYVSVVVAQFNEKPSVAEDLAAKTVDGGYSLHLQNQNPINGALKIHKKERYGSIPQHASVTKAANIKWKIYVDQAGEKSIDVSYSYQGKSNKNFLKIRAADKSLTHTVVPTGKTVAEPNHQDWVIDNFLSHRAGKVNFPNHGKMPAAVRRSSLTGQ